MMCFPSSVVRLMMLILALGVCLVIGADEARNENAAAASAAEFGIILNEDGDIILENPDPDPKVICERLTQRLDTLKGSGINTLAYSLGTGSDILQYPTLVGSTIGWRTAAMEKSEPWASRMPALRAAARAGLDAPRAAGEWAKKNGFRFLLTYRMNDGHYARDPDQNVLTGEFYLKNRDSVTLKQSPVRQLAYFANLLDYSKPEVRAYRKGILIEAAERYQDVMDGLELDFMRHPFLFPPGSERDRGHLLTELLRELRVKLDELGAKNGRHYAVAVRTPPTIKHCHNVGIEIEKWVHGRLVDVIVPSAAMTVSYDMPVGDFAKLAQPDSLKVYAGICNRTQYAWPFVATPTLESYSTTVSNFPKLEAIRAACTNYRVGGSAGIELYNYDLPLGRSGQDVLQAWRVPTGDRWYLITPHYHFDGADYHEPRKQIPADITPDGTTKTFNLLVGEDLSQTASKRPAKCALRLGFHAPDLPASLHTLTVELNGKSILTGSLEDLFVPVTGKQDIAGPAMHPPETQGYVQIPLPEIGSVTQGNNTIALRLTDGKQRIVLSEVMLAITEQP